MKFQIGNRVRIVKDKYSVMSKGLGQEGKIVWAGDKTTPEKDFRLQPEYLVDIDGILFLVLEEEIGSA